MRVFGPVLAAALLAGCPSKDDPEPGQPVGDPWESSVTYRDDEGLFELDFPVEPEVGDEVEDAVGGELTVRSLVASVGDDWQFVLAWSDAPPGTELTGGQQIREGTAEESAQRDGGVVVDQGEVELFGRPALQFTVGGEDGVGGYYHDLMVKVGGRLYELTVIQHDDDRAAFDRFVESFHLLQPPLEEGADFFGTASTLCTTLFGALVDPPEGASSAERSAAVAAIGAAYESLLGQLETTPAAASDQGDAAAFLDSIRRNLEPGRAFADAIARDDPDVEDFGRATRANQALTSLLAEQHDAGACA